MLQLHRNYSLTRNNLVLIYDIIPFRFLLNAQPSIVNTVMCCYYQQITSTYLIILIITNFSVAEGYVEKKSSQPKLLNTKAQ